MRLPGEISEMFEKYLTDVKRICQPHEGKSVDKLDYFGANYIIYHCFSPKIVTEEVLRPAEKQKGDVVWAKLAL